MNATATHTPGPWTASPNGDVVTPEGSITVPGDFSGRILANASLNAASPEMKDALVGLLGAIQSLGLNPAVLAPISSAITTAQATVAKAESRA